MHISVLKRQRFIMPSSDLQVLFYKMGVLFVVLIFSLTLVIIGNFGESQNYPLDDIVRLFIIKI